MIKFMVIGLPRSGTTWAANWLCTRSVHCIHDPLYRYHYSDWDQITAESKWVGIACTGIWHWPDFLANHPAKKVILHRDIAEVDASLAAIGLPQCDPTGPEKLNAIDGLHVPHTDLFDEEGAASIWSYLGLGAMDRIRHAELVQIEMQPKFSGLKVGKDVTRRLMAEILEACSRAAE